MVDTPPIAAPATLASAPLRLEPELTELLRGQLRDVAGHTIRAIMAEVPAYRGALSGRMGVTIENAVTTALSGFLRLATRGRTEDPGTPLSPAIEGAYSLGRGEARHGRSADALLSAYRVGARVAWRELSATAVAGGVPAQTLAAFAELVFAYIDQLSAASVAGHTDELATTGRVRERYRERLARGLLAGQPADVLTDAAERADWEPPRTLTAVVLPDSQVRLALGVVDVPTLLLTEDLPGLPADGGLAVLLVANVEGSQRARLLRALADRSAVAGPARPWLDVRASYDRVLRALALRGDAALVDTEEHLVELVLTADRDALGDLRARVLAPLTEVRPAAAEKLTETLRSWLLHHGRREEMAEELFVHPQTVRYRMGQLRELYGDRLDDPRTLLELTVALGHLDRPDVPDVSDPGDPGQPARPSASRDPGRPDRPGPAAG